MRIFISLGLELFPFSRIIRFFDDFVKNRRGEFDVFIQKGNTKDVPEFCNYVDFMEPDELKTQILRADLTVCHGGVGSVLTVRSLKRTPLIVPRRAELGEHVDNHQIEFCSKIEELGILPVAWTDGELERLILNRADRNYFADNKFRGSISLITGLNKSIEKLLEKDK